MGEPLLFEAERRARCRASRARDLAASASDPHARLRHLADAAHYARATPGTLNEAMLIRR